MKDKKLGFKEGALAFLVAFLLCQLFIFAGQLLTSGILAILNYSQAEMNEFFQSAIGNLIVQACQFVAFVGVFTYFYRKSTLKEECKISKTHPKYYVLFITLGIVTMFSLSNFVNYFSILLNLLDFPTVTIGYHISKTSNYLISIISLAVLPAIGEELLFRGLIFKSFNHKNKLIPILISSISFALFHFNLAQLIYPFLYGLILGIVYSYIDNILVPISIHFVNNFLNITIQYFSKSSSIIIPKHIILLMIVGIIVFICVLSILLFMLYTKEKQTKIETQATSNQNQQNKKQNNYKKTQIQSALAFMKNDKIITILSFSIMLAFYIGIVFLGV